MTYYAYDFDQQDCDFKTKYRLRVEGHTSWTTGEFSHRVIIEAKDICKDFLGRWTKGGKYQHLTAKRVFCCRNAKEAAEYVASEYGLVLA